MFADSLLESSARSHSAAWPKFTSVFLQSAAVAIALLIPLFRMQTLSIVPPPPSVQFTNIQQRVQQTPAQSRVSNAPVANAEPIVQPRFIPSHIANTPAEETSSAAPNPSPIMCVSNCGSAALNSVLTTTGASLPRPAPPSRPVPVSQMQLGDLVRKVIPPYPQIARIAGVQRTVVLHAQIGKDGRVESVQTISGPPMLIAAAVSAVKQWQYRPYILNGEPVVVETSITVHFTLGSN